MILLTCTNYPVIYLQGQNINLASHRDNAMNIQNVGSSVIAEVKYSRRPCQY